MQPGGAGGTENPTPNEEPKEPAVSICDIRGKAASQRGLWQKARLLSTFIGALFPGALVIPPSPALMAPFDPKIPERGAV